MKADFRWQIQEAKQRFSELVRRAQSDGAQFVTRHGADVVVVLDIAEYRRLRGDDTKDFKAFLRSGPSFDDITADRADDRPRPIDLADPQ